MDREGNALTANRTGGTPVLAPNGNRWIGGGHNTVFRDFGGQWWTIYHAIDKDHPFFAGRAGYTKRPADARPGRLGRRLADGPVRSGRLGDRDAGPGGPAAQAVDVQADPGPVRRARHPEPRDQRRVRPGHPRPALVVGAAAGRPVDVRPLRRRVLLRTQAAGLTGAADGASVLTQPAPAGSYAVQTLVRLDVPATGCCQDYVQGGLAIYGSDDRFLKLTHVSAGQTRITEFGKEVPRQDRATRATAASRWVRPVT